MIPLQINRSVNVTEKFVDNKNDEVYIKQYNFNRIGIILAEGIFLPKKGLQPFYDYEVWIDCSFETNLQRARRRNQEGLPQEQLINDYQTCYYPAH